MRLQFLVQGSSSEPYQVLFVRAGDRLSAFCTCPAGEAHVVCKHRLALLNGDGSALVEGAPDQLELLRSWLPRTRLQDAIEALAFAESELDAAKRKVSVAKKVLARVMHEAP